MEVTTTKPNSIDFDFEQAKNYSKCFASSNMERVLKRFNNISRATCGRIKQDQRSNFSLNLASLADISHFVL